MREERWFGWVGQLPSLTFILTWKLRCHLMPSPCHPMSAAPRHLSPLATGPVSWLSCGQGHLWPWVSLIHATEKRAEAQEGGQLCPDVPIFLDHRPPTNATGAVDLWQCVILCAEHPHPPTHPSPWPMIINRTNRLDTNAITTEVPVGKYACVDVPRCVPYLKFTGTEIWVIFCDIF